VVTLHAILYLVRPDKNDKTNWGNTIVKLPAHADGLLWLVSEIKKVALWPI
jgi:hypothetical protein